MDWTCGTPATPIAPGEPAISCPGHRAEEHAYRAALAAGEVPPDPRGWPPPPPPSNVIPLDASRPARASSRRSRPARRKHR